MNLCDIKNIKQIMSIFGIKFHKEFGQNFLTNKMVVEDIADYCCEGKSNTILEIGPGIGTLTTELAECIKLHGKQSGWWTEGTVNYLFGGYDIVAENAWLFLCMY